MKNNNDEDWLIKSEVKKMELDIIATEYKKNQFINEIQKGLGEQILNEPNKKQKKPSFWDKLKRLF